MLDYSRRIAFNADHHQFRETVRRFIQRDVEPFLDKWEQDGIVGREIWATAGALGLLCPQVPEAYGGVGLDFGFNAVMAEELSYAGATLGFGIQNDIVSGYLLHYGSEEQKQKWLPKMAAGETITAIAMAEPGAGSDLRTTARKEGDAYVISGSKTYITNGQHCDLVLVVAKTDSSAGARGTSLILVEADRPGFKRGRNLDKIGQSCADTSELFFDAVTVPVSNLLGEENAGFRYLMSQLSQERLIIAVGAQAGAQRAFDEAVRFTKDRKAFGKTVFDFQNPRFQLAEAAANLQAGWAHLDWALLRQMSGQLTGTEGAAAKLFHAELQWKIVDMALQLHGGAGYMNEYPIARLWKDARVQRIYGGTSEIMKEVIGRSL